MERAEPNKGSELTVHSAGFLSAPAFVSCGPQLKPIDGPTLAAECRSLSAHRSGGWPPARWAARAAHHADGADRPFHARGRVGPGGSPAAPLDGQLHGYSEVQC